MAFNQELFNNLLNTVSRSEEVLENSKNNLTNYVLNYLTNDFNIPVEERWHIFEYIYVYLDPLDYIPSNEHWVYSLVNDAFSGSLVEASHNELVDFVDIVFELQNLIDEAPSKEESCEVLIQLAHEGAALLGIEDQIEVDSRFIELAIVGLTKLKLMFLETGKRGFYFN